MMDLQLSGKVVLITPQELGYTTDATHVRFCGFPEVAALCEKVGLRVVRQFERGVVFRFGRVQSEVRQPGLTRIHPGMDTFRRVNMQIVTMPVPAQDGITRDNVTVKVDAVVYFKVIMLIKSCFHDKCMA